MTESILWFLYGALVALLSVGALKAVRLIKVHRAQQQAEVEEAYKTYPNAPRNFDFHHTNPLFQALIVVAFIVAAPFAYLWLADYGMAVIIGGMMLYAYAAILFID